MDSRSIITTNKNNRGTELRSALSAFMKNNRGFCALLMFLIVCVTVNIIARNNAEFAEWVSANIVAIYTKIMATVTGFLGFSVTEFALLMALPWLVVLFLRCRGRDRTKTSLFSVVKSTVCFVLVVASIFMLTSVCYYRKPIAPQIGIERSTPNAEELLQAMDICSEELEELSDEIAYDANGFSRCKLSYDDIANELIESYSAMSYSFLADMDVLPKQMALSRPMAYAQTTGIFIFMTGEAHYTTEFPDYVTVFSMAHEMAHQRGVMREDEANFMAFLACVTSKNDYLRYAGYVTMVNRLAGAALDADEEAAMEASAKVPTRVINELAAYGRLIRKYEGGFLSKLSNLTNHLYLKSQQQTEGVRSYSLVVELSTAWLLSKK